METTFHRNQFTILSEEDKAQKEQAKKTRRLLKEAKKQEEQKMRRNKLLEQIAMGQFATINRSWASTKDEESYSNHNNLLDKIDEKESSSLSDANSSDIDEISDTEVNKNNEIVIESPKTTNFEKKIAKPSSQLNILSKNEYNNKNPLPTSNNSLSKKEKFLIKQKELDELDLIISGFQNNLNTSVISTSLNLNEEKNTKIENEDIATKENGIIATQGDVETTTSNLLKKKKKKKVTEKPKLLKESETTASIDQCNTFTQIDKEKALKRLFAKTQTQKKKEVNADLEEVKKHFVEEAKKKKLQEKKSKKEKLFYSKINR